MAEVAIPRNVFAEILRLIAELRPPLVASTAYGSAFRDQPTGEMRLDDRKSSRFGASQLRDLGNGTAPEFSYIVPDQCRDMHGLGNVLAPCGGVNDTDDNDVKRGDDETFWTVNGIMGSNTWSKGRNALFIVFDEGNGPLTCKYSPDTPVTDVKPGTLLPGPDCYDPKNFNDRVVFIAITSLSSGTRGIAPRRLSLRCSYQPNDNRPNPVSKGTQRHREWSGRDPCRLVVKDGFRAVKLSRECRADWLLRVHLPRRLSKLWRGLCPPPIHHANLGLTPALKTRWRLRFNRTKKSADPTSCKAGPYLWACKVLGGDRTKMFHVKHF